MRDIRVWAPIVFVLLVVVALVTTCYMSRPEVM